MNQKSVSSDEKYKGYYSEFIQDRKPIDFGNKLISRWHGKLLNYVVKQNQLTQEQRFLEIGPGHGQFAACVKQKLFDYRFVDMSESVVKSMSSLGHDGYLGNLNELPESFGKFDVIWISHVLEHCATWLDAREMLVEAKARLNENGIVIVISPDILSSRAEFWSSDFSHGYPTSIRNVAQMMSDVGLSVTKSSYHRNGRFNSLGRIVPALISRIPHRFIDNLVSPTRKVKGEGYFYSWKTSFGWRQICVVGSKES
jgi:SAM-dependent methyltransferase